MFHLYAVEGPDNEMLGNSVHDKLHRRGAQLCAPTKGNNHRRYGLLNKGIFRNSFEAFLVLLVLFSSLALAHEGFNVVLKDAVVNPYTVTVLEDTHMLGNQKQMNMMIQVAHGRDAAPADTKVSLKLENDNKLVYDNEVKYVGSSSSDGRTYYAYYLVTIPVTEMGMHQAMLELDGSLGSAKTDFRVDVKLTPNFRAVELIPSLLVISICFAGLALFVISARTPAQKTSNTQKGLSHA
jgi:hypothetical protein